MACILCFSSKHDVGKESEDFYGIYDYNEKNGISAVEMIKCHLNYLTGKILTDDIIANSESCLCETCWDCLDNFHNFASMVEANYQSQELIEETNEDQIESLDADVIKEEVMIVKEYPPDPDVILKNDDIAELNWIEVEEEVIDDQDQTSKNYSNVYGASLQEEIFEDDKKIQNHAEMTCDICKNFKFKNLKDAKTHMRLDHKVEGYIMCCNRQFKQRIRLLEHVKTVHMGLKHHCELCNKKFESKSYLMKHMAIHDTQKRFECDSCGKIFAQKFQVRSHLLNVHALVGIVASFECPHEGCESKFVTEARLRHHIKYRHPTNVKICYYCPKTFKTKNSLDEHLKIHSRRPEDRIKCEICGHYLADVKTYKRHLKNHQTESSDNVCMTCGKKAPNANALKRHIQYVHEKACDHHCEYCDKSFKRARNLQDHVAAIHTLEDLYNCDFCDRKFRNHSNMLSHRKKQHPDLYQKPIYMRDQL